MRFEKEEANFETTSEQMAHITHVGVIVPLGIHVIVISMNMLYIESL